MVPMTWMSVATEAGSVHVQAAAAGFIRRDLDPHGRLPTMPPPYRSYARTAAWTFCPSFGGDAPPGTGGARAGLPAPHSVASHLTHPD